VTPGDACGGCIATLDDVFKALGRLATRHPWYVVIGWIVVSVLIILTAPKLSSTADQSEFLPGKYESIRAANLQTDAFPQQTSVGALVVFDRTDGGKLTTSDTATIKKVVGELNGKVDKVFSGVVAQPPSQNNLVQLAVVGISKDKSPYDPDAIDAAKKLRADAHAAVDGSDLTVGVTGAAAQALDSQDASSKSEAIVGISTFGLILVLMVVIFRSVILALFPLLVIGLVSQVAVGLIGAANKVFDLKTDSSIQVILIVVLFGIGTDYILFFLFR
jgi:putative drug exporter of the RND superfamily